MLWVVRDGTGLVTDYQVEGTAPAFGNNDNLAWDLGDPQGNYQARPPGQIDPALEGFHPMKGPMATQSLRGMASHGPMHWRGDRTGGNDAPSEQPDSGTFDKATQNVIAAFQMHYRPARYDGILDAETAAILQSLD